MKKILIIRFSSIGDIVLTTPVIRCIKNQLEQSEVHFLTKKSFQDILLNNPFIDKVITFENDLVATIKLLKAEKYDYIIDLHHNLRSARVKSALGVPSKSFNKLNIEKWLIVNLNINRLPKAHIVDRYMQTASATGVFYDGKGLDFFIPENDEVKLNSLPDPWAKGYAAFVIGAMHTTKRLPNERIREIIQKIKLPVILIGGKDDKIRSSEIANGLENLVMDGCGNYNLSQSASLVKQARFVLTHDTGLMHIAAAFQQRIISFWGNTIPEFGMAPFLPIGRGESIIIENSELSCRPCTKIGYNVCPKKHFKCMNDLDFLKVTETAQMWWSSTPQSS